MSEPAIKMSTTDDINIPIVDSQAARREFGERLSTRSVELGMGQAALARKSGLSRQLVGTYWHGQKMPMPENLGPLASALGVDPIWLATGQTDDGLGAIKSTIGSPEWVLIPFYSFDDIPNPGAAIEPKPREIPVRRAWLDRLGAPCGTWWSTEMPVDGLRGLADTGDLLICDHAPDQLREGQSYIFMLFSTRIVRRAVMTPGGIALVGDENLEPVPLPAGKTYNDLPNVTCLGRVAAVYKMIPV